MLFQKSFLPNTNNAPAISCALRVNGYGPPVIHRAIFTNNSDEMLPRPYVARSVDLWKWNKSVPQAEFCIYSGPEPRVGPWPIKSPRMFTSVSNLLLINRHFLQPDGRWLEGLQWFHFILHPIFYPRITLALPPGSDSDQRSLSRHHSR